jgi:hypothetical protein
MSSIPCYSFSEKDFERPDRFLKPVRSARFDFSESL